MDIIMDSNEDLDKIYSKILNLLMIKSLDFNFEEFNLYIGLLEDVLLSRGLGLKDLNSSNVFLLIYYFIGCELKKRGKLLYFDLGKIKSERLGEVSVEYFDDALRGEVLVNNFCSAFNNLVEDIKTNRKVLIGVV
ncbi:uncharacterized conserved protein (plasmid) [Borrelia duttonii Ly]|uniref:Uncharacterized conserved protein n=2 Tax=Borrelia duttonii TaxID=40834 RepID=B5RNF2_BORDL|nr:uncharacterized conserved protein [Borrelia duttonii Ly]